MHVDLLFSVTILLAIVLFAFLATARFCTCRRGPAISLVLLATLGFGWIFAGRLDWAKFIPSQYVVFLANITPVLLSVAAGLAFKSHQITRFARPLTAAVLLTLALAYATVPYFRPNLHPLVLSSQTLWKDSTCLQSHPSSCAPAAAVTLMRLHGVHGTEQSLATWCLTSEKGTESLGLYRGLVKALDDNRKQPKVASANPDHWSRQAGLPNVSLVRLGQCTRDWSTVKYYGSIRWLFPSHGEGHAIVVVGKDESGNWKIIDPAFGETVWTDEQMKERFTGEAIYLASK